MYFYIKDLNIVDKESDIAFYAGFLAASFSFAQFITSLFWGWLSDRIGRKPVLLTGLFGNSITMLVFGLSKNYYLALISRIFCGALNGNLGVVKSSIAEITDDTNSPAAFGLFNITWAMGSLFGPILGGFLANPATTMPSIFGSCKFLIEYPYFLPPFVSALISCVGFVLSLFCLPETSRITSYRAISDEPVSPIPNNRQSFVTHKLSTSFANLTNTASRSASVSKYNEVNKLIKCSVSTLVVGPSILDEEKEESGANVEINCLDQRSWTSLLIFLYTLLAFGNSIIDEIYNIWTAEKPSDGGLGFSSGDIGLSLTVIYLL
jgi:MFS family permease